MQKLMKNWVFTMIACILLVMLAVLLFLDGFDVGGLHIADRLLHLVAALALLIYTVFALFPLVVRYGGVLRGFVLGEIVLLLLTALAHICMEWVAVPLISSMQVCAVLGLVLWLRGTVEILHAYFSATEEGEKRMPLWKLLVYILLSAVGVWQMADPLIPDKVFVFAVGAVAGVMAILFAVITASNRKASASARAAKKQKKAEEKAAAAASEESSPAEEAPTALLEKKEEE